MKRHNASDIDIDAVLNGVPSTGNKAFEQGWDKTANPYRCGPQRDVWDMEWEGASAEAWKSHKEGLS